jgi:mono/diheme cytochrome c family protein
MHITNKKIGMVLKLTLALTLVSIALPIAGKQPLPPQNDNCQSPPLIQSLKGPDLFQAYCASCHGLDARGTGPVARVLKIKVPDLTVLTRTYHGQFPAAYVRLVILGDSVVVPHGSREMPIWGPIFHQVERDMDWGDVRVANLVEYLKSIQSTDPSRVPSGAELYDQDCAVCHGRDLKGTGPVPEPFRAPTDLTTLARKHGGNFPDEFVSNVLRNGVLIPAHGPAEMPIWGIDFRGIQWPEHELSQRIANLTSYIKAHQEK